MTTGGWAEYARGNQHLQRRTSSVITTTHVYIFGSFSTLYSTRALDLELQESLLNIFKDRRKDDSDPKQDPLHNKK